MQAKFSLALCKLFINILSQNDIERFFYLTNSITICFIQKIIAKIQNLVSFKDSSELKKTNIFC